MRAAIHAIDRLIPRSPSISPQLSVVTAITTEVATWFPCNRNGCLLELGPSDARGIPICHIRNRISLAGPSLGVCVIVRSVARLSRPPLVLHRHSAYPASLAAVRTAPIGLAQRRLARAGRLSHQRPASPELSLPSACALPGNG